MNCFSSFQLGDLLSGKVGHAFQFNLETVPIINALCLSNLVSWKCFDLMKQL